MKDIHRINSGVRREEKDEKSEENEECMRRSKKYHVKVYHYYEENQLTCKILKDY